MSKIINEQELVTSSADQPPSMRADTVDPHEIRLALAGLRELMSTIQSDPISCNLKRAYDRIARIRVVEYEAPMVG